MGNANRRAFTLVEILVAVTISVIVVLLLWQLVSTGLRQMSYGTWYSTSTAQLRTGLRKLREDIGRANYPSKITPSSAEFVEPDNHKVKLKLGTIKIRETQPTSLKLVEFFICKPERSDFPGGANEPEIRIQCTLEARGRTLYYTKKPTKGSPPPQDLYDKALIGDVDEVKITDTSPPAGSGADINKTAEIEIKTSHPTNPEKSLIEKSSVRIAVDLVAL